MAAVEPAGTADRSDGSELKPPPGVVIPPAEIRVFIEKSADLASRKDGIEERLRKQAESGSIGQGIQFILPDNPFHPYFQWRMSEHRAGRGQNGAGDAQGTKQVKKGPSPPADFEFSARMPTINAVDLEIVKLTALFVAKNGQEFLTDLARKEKNNYQFDFLRPQHSFFQFFQRIVDQYRDLLMGDVADGGAPQRKKMKELEHNVQDRFHVLERARKRAEWIKHQERQKVKKEEDAEKERLEYAQIDWHDFVVVGTIDFTEEDNQADLPPPTSLNDLQSASLEQKAAMSLAPVNMRIDEAMPEHAEFFNIPQMQTPTPQPIQMAPPPMPYAPSPQPHPSAASPAPYQPYRSAQDQEDEARIAERAAERERAQQAQAAAKGTGPMRIRNDYVPRAQARRQAATTVLCSICSQQIPSDEYDQHVRIEMLDPRWRDQNRLAQARSSTTNLSTADVANNLKRLASQRPDMFDPVTGAALSEDEAKRRKRVEMSSYDGHSQTPSIGASGIAAPPPGMAGQSMSMEGKPADVQAQIRQLQSKYGQG